ncbi:MAG: alpha/beta hydrolase family protein [Aestuariibacter sp.]
MRFTLVCILLCICSAQASALDKGDLLDFQFESETLNGVINLPQNKTIKGIILLIHGYGETHAVKNNWYSDIRSIMIDAGYGTYMWDKMGCGDSTGTFDINQPVANSADEAIAAITMLQARNIPGSGNIGLWGISRAGWINPLIIKKYQDIAFWVSVSGVDGKENFSYLLEKNLIIDGVPQKKASLIASEWRRGMQIAHKGGSYSEFKNATRNLAKNEFWLRFTEGGFGFLTYPFLRYELRNAVFDEKSGLQVHVEHFEKLLNDMNIPVLALFGEQDMNVDWRNTKRLYQRTLNKELLTIASFPNCNHSIFEAKTGGYYEFEDSKLPYKRCEGFLETTAKWLKKLKLDTRG